MIETTQAFRLIQDNIGEIKENVMNEMSSIYSLGYSQGNHDGYSKALDDASKSIQKLDDVKTLSPQEFNLEMLRIKNESGDSPEEAHSRMDDLLCNTLVALGYGAGIEVFKNQEMWYS